MKWKIFSIVLILIPAFVLAETYYVRTDGNDAQDGLQNLPGHAWADLSVSIKKLKAGDSLLVNDGEYKGDTVWIKNLHGAPEQPITIKALNTWAAVINRVEEADPDTSAVVVAQSSYISFEGFEVFDLYGMESGVDVRDNSHHIVIKDCYIHDCACGGISSRKSDYLTFDSNVVRDNAKRNKWNCSGISVWHPIEIDQEPGYHIIITNNVAFENECDIPFTPLGHDNPTDGNGIIIDDFRATQQIEGALGQAGGYMSSALVENNLCFNNGGKGINIYKTDNATIRNNITFYNNRILQKYSKYIGEITIGNSNGTQLYNNLIVQNPDYETFAFTCYQTDSSGTSVFDNTIVGGVNFGNQTIDFQNNVLKNNSHINFKQFLTDLGSFEFDSIDELKEKWLSFADLGLVHSPGGGNLNPGLFTNEKSMDKFQDMRIGLSVHWGPSSLGGKEISWARDKEIPKETYDNLYKEFNPVNFDADEWVKVAIAGGMQYILLTSKHHDGFCLWPSKVTPYNIFNTPFKRDIVKELSDACKKAGITFGSYYSILDWYHPDYYPNEHGGPGELLPTFDDTPNFERYLVFMKTQLRELIVHYGAEIIQFDGEWDPTWNHQLGSDLYLYMRKLNDNVLINSRTDVGRYHLDAQTGQWDWQVYAGDFEERERMVDWVNAEEHSVHGKSKSPWQAWVTIDQAQWSWNETPRLLSVDEIIVDMLKTIGDNGNYLINMGPQPDGKFNDEQVAIIKKVGKWIQKHKDGIYGTRGGPFVKEGVFTSTIKGDTIFLYVFDSSITSLDVLTQDLKITHVTDYFENSLKYDLNEKSISIKIPKHKNSPLRVLKITLDKIQAGIR